jgi:hypothetical protein
VTRDTRNSNGHHGYRYRPQPVQEQRQKLDPARQMEDNITAGLADEILRTIPYSQLSESTVRLLTIVCGKVADGVPLNADERRKVEGIYTYLCRG